MDANKAALGRRDHSFPNLWDELIYRDAVHVSTDRDELREALNGPPITFYCGFEPTASSLHLGNLVQLILMRRLQLAGHRPIALVGGSTGLVGDPKMSTERQLNEPEIVAGWAQDLHAQISRFLSFDGPNAATLVNNLDWTAGLSALDFLRDIGSHLRVGTMIKKDVVAARLDSGDGISFTEFSYQALQGMDYLHLYRDYGCVLQTGGSDQWGNLTAGTELVRKIEGVSVHAIGTPLITDATGKKFGKSEGNAIWLDASLTSPQQMAQFWFDQPNSIVIALLKTFTFLGRDRIEELARSVKAEPTARMAQRILAFEATAVVHGYEASAALFGSMRTVGRAGQHQRPMKPFSQNKPPPYNNTLE